MPDHITWYCLGNKKTSEMMNIYDRPIQLYPGVTRHDDSFYYNKLTQDSVFPSTGNPELTGIIVCRKV